MEKYEIYMDDLKKAQENGWIIIDVRSKQEYDEFHINYAKNIPYYKIRKCIKNLCNNKNQFIILYCESGFRSQKAYKILKNMGYNNLHCLYGGLENYLIN